MRRVPARRHTDEGRLQAGGAASLPVPWGYGQSKEELKELPPSSQSLRAHRHKAGAKSLGFPALPWLLEGPGWHRLERKLAEEGEDPPAPGPVWEKGDLH